MTICRDLEKKYKLHTPTMKEQRSDEAPTKKIDYRKGDIKHQVGNITKSIMGNFHFQSFGEYRTLLEMFNVTAEEVKGERNGKAYPISYPSLRDTWKVKQCYVKYLLLICS